MFIFDPVASFEILLLPVFEQIGPGGDTYFLNHGDDFSQARIVCVNGGSAAPAADG